MYDLVLIDDETGQLEIMAQIIRAVAHDFDVKIFSQSAAAVNYIQSNHVDAVISDIRMPVIDGLELSKRLHEQFPDIVIAILSAYSDFSYAQKAIETGVITYMVKPVSKAKISDMMEKIRGQLEKVRQLEGIRSLKLNQQLLSWLNGSLDAENSRSIGGLFDGFSWGFWSVSEFTAEQKLSEEAKSILVVDFKQRVKSAFPKGRALAVELDGKGLLFACAVAFRDQPDETEAFSALQHALSRFPAGLTVYTGVSEISEGFLEKRAQEYQTAKRLLSCRFLLTRQFLISEKAILQCKLLDAARFYSLENRLMDSLRQSDSSLAARYLEEFSKQYTDNGYYAESRQALEYFTHIAYTLKKQWGCQAGDQIIEDLNSADSLPQACACLKKFVEFLLQSRSTQNANRTEDIMRRVKEYLYINCGEDLTLEQVAEIFHFNATYLSSIFKQYTQTGFKEYVTSVRIERSKYLLKETDLKVYEIAKQCGYPDAAYFVRLFKKEVGISPNRFRGVSA